MSTILGFNEDKVVKEKVSDKIFNILLNDIISGNYKVGDKLPPERFLAEKFEVHRNSVREALKRLEMSGIVDIRQGNGAIVKNIYEGNVLLLEAILTDPKNINEKILNDLLSLRRALEPIAAKEASRNITDEGLKKLNWIIEIEKDNLKNRDGFYKIDFMFHSLIITESNNLILQLVINSIKSVYTNYTKIFFRIPGVVEYVYGMHKKIVEAMKYHDEESAEKLMVELLNHGEKNLMKIIKGGNDE